MPKEYAEMMKKCWNVDPSKRPTIRKLIHFADNYLDNIHKRESSNNDYNNLQQIREPHPLAYHSSRILDNDIAKYKSLQQDLELGLISEAISKMNIDDSKF